MRRLMLLFAALFLLPLSAWAGGSVSLQDLGPLLAARLDLAQKLEGWSVAPVGVGFRIGNQVCPALGGLRVGPYEFAAERDGVHVTALFHTRDRFYDAEGRELAQYLDALPVQGDDISNAVRVDERLEDITFAE